MGSHPVSERSIKRRYLYISLVPPLPASGVRAAVQGLRTTLAGAALMGGGTPLWRRLVLLGCVGTSTSTPTAVQPEAPVAIVVTPTYSAIGGTAGDGSARERVAQISWPDDVQIVGSVHEAREAVRAVLTVQPSSHVDVHLLPGVHHVGSTALHLNAQDGAAAGGSVTWKSADASNPASVVSSFSVSQSRVACISLATNCSCLPCAACALPPPPHVAV